MVLTRWIEDCSTSVEDGGRTYVTFIGLESRLRFLPVEPSRSSSPRESDSDGELEDAGGWVGAPLALPLFPA